MRKNGKTTNIGTMFVYTCTCTLIFKKAESKYLCLSKSGEGGFEGR